jgi:Enoyl-CoA hydratase/isomerase
MADESSDLVLLERRDDGVAVITLNNPKVNALSSALLARLGEIAAELTANPPGAVVVTGGERIFAAGANIAEFGGPDEAAMITAGFHSALDALATPSVAAANSHSPATTGSSARKRSSASLRSSSESSPAAAAPSDWRARLVRARPRKSA